MNLVIIDMQPEFMSSHDVPKAAILREIELAKRNNRYIFVVEYDECGRTLHYIRNALRNYPYKRLVKKYDDNGSTEVHYAIRKVTRSKKIRICGVNTDCCVYETANGLDYLGYKVESVADACNSEHGHYQGIEKLSKISRILRKREDRFKLDEGIFLQ